MITVIADDLTGAAEIAGICLRHGIDVAFGIDSIPEKEATVNVIATDSRSLTEEEAYQVHLQIANKILKKNSEQIIFKKCDSVLRGYVITELSALMSASEKKSVLLQSSNPIGNRCIRNGIYFVNDIKIENTSFLSDPDFPSKTSSVKNLLLERSSKNTMEIYTKMINKINSKGVYIPDCNSEADLKKNLNLYSEKIIIGGSAAFFEQFLIKMNLTSKIKVSTKYSVSEGYLLASGSAHPKSIIYSEMLQNNNCPVVTFQHHLLLEHIKGSDLRKWKREIAKIYKENKKLGLRISNDIIHFDNCSKELKNRMSLVIKELFKTSEIDELFIEGGATAYDILKKLEWNSFTPTSELAPGVVRIQYDRNIKKHITIKPGSYEWPDELLN